MKSFGEQYKNTTVRISMAIVCGFIPILSCILFCLFLGESFQSIFLPNTACSDDIFYYKMVEGMVKFGYPLGYFGYNESHALVCSFGAWSPVLLLPWTLWGKIFGWGYLSPIICNICLVSIGFVVFSFLAEPTLKQVLSIALQFLLVTPFIRYMLSGMPEAVCYMLIIIMYGIVYSYFKHENTYKLILIFMLATFLTLMRPYFVVLLILPGILWVRKSKLLGLLGTGLIIFINLLGYGLITFFFSAQYFYSSMATDFIDSFRSNGVIAGCLFLLNKIYDRWSTIKWYMLLGIKEGFTDGQIYFACCVVILFLFLWLLHDLIKKKQKGVIYDKNIDRNIVMELSQLLSFLSMLLAIFVLYQIPEGSRHILTFLIGFILVSSMRDNYSLEKNCLVVAMFAYLFVVKYDNDSGYKVPYSGEDVIQEVEIWENEFSDCVGLNEIDTPNFDNVVDWVIEDTVDGETKEIPWRALFALPEGMGINCCLSQYIAENFNDLNSRYILTVSNGQIDFLCHVESVEELLRNDYFVLYKRY